jgi:hypothetical protein
VKRAFDVPRFLTFARGGKKALAAALRSIRSHPSSIPPEGLARPAIVVTGPARSGKSLLVRAIIEHFYSGAARACCFPGSEDTLQNRIPGLLDLPYVWFDDAPLRALRSNTLKCFITHSHWQYRRLHHQSEEIAPIFTRVFLSGSVLDVPPDFARRAIVIELKSDEGGERQFVSAPVLGKGGAK